MGKARHAQHDRHRARLSAARRARKGRAPRCGHRRLRSLGSRIMSRLRLLGGAALAVALGVGARSEEHTSELQSLMRISYAVFCLKKKTQTQCSTRRRERPTAIQNKIVKIRTLTSR